MDDEASNFFPKGVTALIIYRAIPRIPSFAGLSDYLTVLGKELSGGRKVYRQRRNKVLKYALKKLREAHMVKNGEAPGTYIAMANYEGYLNFLKHNASDLYERTKFYISWSINEMVRSIAEEYEKFMGFAEISNNAHFNRSLDLESQLRISLNKHGLFDKTVFPFVLGRFEPYLGNKEQVDLLKLLLDSMDFTPEDTDLAVEDIILNYDKQSGWINERIGKFLGLEEGVYSKYGGYLDFYAAELDAVMEIVGKEEYVREHLEAIGRGHPRDITLLGTTKTWWLIQFQKNLKKIVNDLET
ncbi:MAG: hypothetical protein M0Z77_08030 [Thermoplasmatales archaeon]|nr:hypothetical protein [Thermoplasmatales archaeon]